MIIDSHCHIDFEVFDPDRDQVLKDASNAGINKIIVPGVKRDSWSKIRDCCAQYPQLYPCYGLHPYFINQHNEQDLQALSSWVAENKTIAIGECGLDYFLKQLDKEKQQFYFEQQLELAMERQLPVIIHARKSTEDVIKAIKQRPGLRGMIHSYSGSYEQALQLIELGFYLSFGEPVTYENSSRLRKTVQSLPLQNILLETDAPDQPGSHAAGKRNEPAYIVEVVENIAKLHHTSTSEVASITAANANRLFQLV